MSWKRGTARLKALRRDLDRFLIDGPSVPRVTPRVFGQEVDQALDARSEERYRHYLRTLTRSLGEANPAPHSDINLRRWKEYDDILTESLWVINRRDSTGVHSAEYHGNFVPQIPHQVIRRFTKPGEIVLDLFAGLGTTLIEAQRLGRPSIGVELDPAIAEAAREGLDREAGPAPAQGVVIVADSSVPSTRSLVRRQMRAWGKQSAQLVVLHPPYHDIIAFSGLPGDLSSALTVDEFLRRMEGVIDLAWHHLDPGRFMVLVIGDKYERGRWVPLGFKTMARAERRGFRLKSIVVKNMEGNRAKRGVARLWARRAIAGDFYIFKHEYVFIFEKPRAVPAQVSLTDLPKRGAPRRRAGSRKGGRKAARRSPAASGRSRRRRN